MPQVIVAVAFVAVWHVNCYNSGANCGLRRDDRREAARSTLPTGGSTHEDFQDAAHAARVLDDGRTILDRMHQHARNGGFHGKQ
jgi:hypothetical protein